MQVELLHGDVRARGSIVDLVENDGSGSMDGNDGVRDCGSIVSHVGEQPAGVLIDVFDVRKWNLNVLSDLTQSLSFKE